MNKTMYSAKFSYGATSLIKITIAKETKHTISISDKEVMIGDSRLQYFGHKQVYKNSLNLFDTLKEAANFLIQEIEENNKNLQDEISNNNAIVEVLKNDKSTTTG
jgi:hypothetical protein